MDEPLGHYANLSKPVSKGHDDLGVFFVFLFCLFEAWQALNFGSPATLTSWMLGLQVWTSVPAAGD